MLLSLLAARARLLRTPAARCASIATRSLNSNVTVASTQLNRLQVAKPRAFSTVDGPKDDDEEVKEELSLEDDDDQNQPNDSEMSPLERLMQHAQQLQLETELDDNDDAQGDDATPERSESDDMFANEWNAINDSAKSKSNSGSSGVFKRNTFRRRGNSDRHWKLGRRAEGHVIGKDTDEIDYDAELENVWDDEQLKQRKFHQALRREEDKNHICTNCGERGHRARNCLIPRICSNCGTLGHTARQCRYRRNPDSIDEFLLEEEAFQQKRKKNQKLRKKAAKAANNPSMPRLKELPTSDLNKRNESLRQELDAELEAYADMLEERDRKRKKD